MTIEQQKDYVRRYIEGCRAAEENQLASARNRTDAEAWRDAEIVLGGWHEVMARSPRRGEETGLVEQQRWFRRGWKR